FHPSLTRSGTATLVHLGDPRHAALSAAPALCALAYQAPPHSRLVGRMPPGGGLDPAGLGDRVALRPQAPCLSPQKRPGPGLAGIWAADQNAAHPPLVYPARRSPTDHAATQQR